MVLSYSCQSSGVQPPMASPSASRAALISIRYFTGSSSGSVAVRHHYERPAVSWTPAPEFCHAENFADAVTAIGHVHKGHRQARSCSRSDAEVLQPLDPVDVG